MLCGLPEPLRRRNELSLRTTYAIRTGHPIVGDDVHGILPMKSVRKDAKLRMMLSPNMKIVLTSLALAPALAATVVGVAVHDHEGAETFVDQSKGGFGGLKGLAVHG